MALPKLPPKFAPPPLTPRAPIPDALVGHDSSTGQLGHMRTVGEFDKGGLAPLPVDKLVSMAFPSPTRRYADDEQLQLLFEAAEKEVAKRSQQTAMQAALNILDRLQKMPGGSSAVGVLPPEAIKVCLDALTFGVGIDVSRVAAAKPVGVAEAAADQEALSMVDESDFDDCPEFDF